MRARWSIVACTTTVLLFAFSAADAADPAILIGFTEAPGAERINLVDQRPAEEKQTYRGSLNIMNCNYGVYRVGDLMSQPGRVTLLRSDLAAALGSLLDGRTVVVKHYGIYVNNQLSLRSSAAAATAGATGNGVVLDVLKGMTAECPPEKMNGGWYGDGEKTTEFSPVVAELTVEVDGRELAVRKVVSSPKGNVRLRASDETFVTMLFDAMRGVTAELVMRFQSAR